MPALAPPPATVRTWDGLDLVVRHWPTPTAPRGRIHLVHGLGEHLGRYEHVAAHLNARGWDVTGHDQRGHGASPGARGALRAGDDLIEDLARVLDVVRPSAGQCVLMGHSMGGLVAAQFVAAKRGAVDRLLLTSPALDAALGPLQKLQLAFGMAFVPDLAMGNQLDATRISHDPEVVRRYLADPLVHDRITARLAKALLDGGAFVRARAASWTVPTLLLWAGRDHLVSPGGSAAFAAAAPRDVVTARCFDDLYHEILNERDAAPVYATIDAWLDATA
jgi:alpha-beta hydrolase superfamily lysophospholipase